MHSHKVLTFRTVHQRSGRTSPSVRRALSLALLMSASCPAFAQVEEQGANQIPDIVVTARRQAESLQNTPISVSVLTAEALEQRQAIEMAEAVQLVPNMQFDVGSSYGGSSALSSIYIRGIGQSEAQLSVDPGVALYVDGVYMTRLIGQTLDLVDIDRVEVLRGPQGTLFGRNTIGGALNIATRRPGDKLAASINAQVGSDFDMVLRGSVSGPLGEGLRAGASVLYHHRDNYIEGVSGARSSGGRDAFSGRLVVDADLADNLLFSLSLDGTTSREPGLLSVPVAYYDGSAFGEAHNAFFSGAAGVCTDYAGAARFSDTRCYNAQWRKGQFRTAGTHQTPESHDAIIQDLHGHRFKPRQELDMWGVSGQFSWRLSAELEFKSITAFRSARLNYAHDGDHSPHLIVHNDDKNKIDSFTQEFQAIGNHLDGRLKWLVGAFYFYEDGFTSDIVDTNLVMFQSGAAIKTDSYAAFGQATYDLVDQLSLTVGLRYTDEAKTFAAGDRFVILADFGLGIPAGTPVLPIGQVAKAKSDAFTPMASLSFKPTEELNLYVSYSQGFKGGGFTQAVFPAAPTIPSFNPERVTSYEAGVKFLGFDRKLRINGAVFHGDYKDIQVTVIEGVAPTIRNAAKGRIRGGELEIQAAPADGLRLEGSLGYLDAEYLEVSGAAALAGLTVDKKFVNAPEWTLAVAASYSLDVGGGQVTPRAEWSYRSRTYNNAVNTPEISQPSYHLFNALISYSDPDDRWLFSAGVKNIGNKRYLMSGYADPAGIGMAEGVYDRGRVFFVSARGKY